MATFLLKTEPSTFSYSDLVREGKTVWDGVTNPAALAGIRAMRKGDEAFVYHTGEEKAIVGVATVASDPYEDPKKPGLNDRGEPKFAVVDLKPTRAVKSVVTLAAIKADPRFAGFALVRQSRLSVMEVPTALDKLLREMAGL
jgi:predicted RNA-binding protein with PUA-like domain